ncbi:HNH endonuclease [Rhodococcus sp. CSLK01-03]|uniref:HNH endonuclease n=1 Tax=Rhodococcus indonesiensis TaxID=3055869 RepID=A0ABT7RM22_9NOCA|nr:HNH endonuclease [Rhodococcus indonesiensis]MDM7488688.1 HNH endonuclease [Rhodococcus indonesiensis]
MTDQQYPAEAYAPTGELWWTLQFHPGKKMPYGAERKIAAWLYFNKSVGSTFTMRELREALGADNVPNNQEHLNRRMRQLRKLGWRLPSSQEVAGLKPDEYKVAEQGWHPGLGERPKTAGMIGARLRRQVFERDGNRCVICGVGRGEPYPDPPPGVAVMSVGHRIPQEFGGTDDLDNLQTECKRCNEQVREEAGLPETLDEVYAEIKGLKRTEKTVLLQWLRSGRRLRSKVDTLYDRARRLSESEKETLIERLETATNAAGADSGSGISGA